MTLYVDIIFMENVFMNSIILLATGIILKDSMKIVRNLIGSTIGALYAIIIYVSNIAIYSNIILKILLSFVIVYISFKPANLKSFFKHVVIFYLTSFTFGGVAFALLHLVSKWSFNWYIPNKDDTCRRNTWVYYYNNCF